MAGYQTGRVTAPAPPEPASQRAEALKTYHRQVLEVKRQLAVLTLQRDALDGELANRREALRTMVDDRLAAVKEKEIVVAQQQDELEATRTALASDQAQAQADQAQRLEQLTRATREADHAKLALEQERGKLTAHAREAREEQERLTQLAQTLKLPEEQATLETKRLALSESQATVVRGQEALQQAREQLRVDQQQLDIDRKQLTVEQQQWQATRHEAAQVIETARLTQEERQSLNHQLGLYKTRLANLDAEDQRLRDWAQQLEVLERAMRVRETTASRREANVKIAEQQVVQSPPS